VGEGGKEGGGTKTTTTSTNNVQPNRKVTRIKQQLRFDHVTTKDVQRKKSWWVRTSIASQKLNKKE
jgi:molybdenum-dependent DNA-binding transcriptional regulator ModE